MRLTSISILQKLKLEIPLSKGGVSGANFRDLFRPSY